MKKTFKFLGITLAVLFVFIFVACKDDPPKGEEPATYADFDGKEIPIYAGEGVTKEQAAAKKSDIETAYNIIPDATQKAAVKSKIQMIRVVAGDECSHSGGVVEIGLNCITNDIRSYFGAVFSLSKVIDNSRETVRMAFAAVNSWQRNNFHSIEKMYAYFHSCSERQAGWVA
jgi:hypothetical protein